MKNKFLLWCGVVALILHMVYISPAYAWGNGRQLYARIAIPGEASAIDGLTSFIHGPVDEYQIISGSNGMPSNTIKVWIRGKVYITNTSNVLLYHR